MTNPTSSRIRDVVVLCWSTPANLDRRAQKIAAFLGADTTTVALTPAALADETRAPNLVPRCTCLIVDAETLARAVEALPGGVMGLRRLTTDVAAHVFVYGFQSIERHDAILQELSSGALLGVGGLPDADSKFHVTSSQREWCGQFSGLSLGQVEPTREHPFIEGPQQQSHVFIRAGEAPFFVRVQKSGSEVFLVASLELADLDERVKHNARPLSWFSRLVPLMMFLRGALEERVWHSDNPRACFIIDDPLLTNRYGFLQYKRLVESLHRRKFSVSIAFIPWNYTRSRSEVAALLSGDHVAPSLCVHGCDHTDSEFATNDGDTLRAKARLALERMRTHQLVSGVPFDDVMVFPQGRFSTEAITALKAAGYLATVNGDVYPAEASGTVALRDLLEVAVTRFEDFPLFGRRYPRDLAEFALDLFMGKPAFVVEHHGYFRKGYGDLESFVDQLNGLDNRLEWTNLATICSRACVSRTTESGDVQVRFFTKRFTVQNGEAHVRRFCLLRRRPADERPPSVTVDGHECEWHFHDDQFQVSLSLDAGQIAHVVVTDDGTDVVRRSWRASRVYRAKVRARRVLGELRDNYVDTALSLFGR